MYIVNSRPPKRKSHYQALIKLCSAQAICARCHSILPSTLLLTLRWNSLRRLGGLSAGTPCPCEVLAAVCGGKTSPEETMFLGTGGP